MLDVKRIALLALAVNSEKLTLSKFVQTTNVPPQSQICAIISEDVGTIQSEHPYQPDKACRFIIRPPSSSVAKNIQIRITDIDIEPGYGRTCEDDRLALTVNGQQFGPYCGFASRFQYEQDDEVDGFDILDHSDGLLPNTDDLFKWRTFQLNRTSNPIEIYFSSGPNANERYGWRIEWRTEV